MIRYLLAALTLAFACGWTVTATAEAPSTDPYGIIAQMIQRNPSLTSYKARVSVAIHMRNFPFLSPKLSGTSYFKRPDNFEVTFDRVPSYAKGFSRLFNDIGDPSAWQKDQDISFDGTRSVDGTPMLVLRLTKKIHSDILDHTLAFVDPTTYELRRMEWHYTNGGLVVMTQVYRQEGGYALISAQHAAIDIPFVHAIADSTYANYDTNVAIDDSVFKQ